MDCTNPDPAYRPPNCPPSDTTTRPDTTTTQPDTTTETTPPR
jgi:hypothetical protein